MLNASLLPKGGMVEKSEDLYFELESLPLEQSWSEHN